MPQFKREIRIVEDDTATYERRIVIPRTTAQSATERMVERKRVKAEALLRTAEQGLLPPRCRMVRTRDEVTVFVCEEPMALHTVSWNLDRHSQFVRNLFDSGAHRLFGESPSDFRRRVASQKTFHLAFPYVVKCYRFFGDAFTTLSLWYRREPIVSEDDVLYKTNLPNTGDNGDVCLTDVAKDLHGGTFIDMLAKLEAEFWGSGWNADWSETFMEYASAIPELASPWHWERASRRDPTFVMRVPWFHGITVREEVESLLSLNHVDAETPYYHEHGKGGVFSLLERRMEQALAGRRNGHHRAESRRRAVGTVRTTRIRSGTLRAGDTLEFTRTFSPDCITGSRRFIEWFAARDPRLVKLEGVREPLRLIRRGRLVRSVRECASESPAIVIGGVTLDKGAILLVTDRHAWPEFNGQYQVVARAMQGNTGEIMVHLKNKEDEPWKVIGENATLFPGLSLLPAEAQTRDGYLRSRSVTLSCGTVLRVGMSILFDIGGGYFAEGVIARFHARAPNSDFRNLTLISGTYIKYETVSGALSPNVMILSDTTTDIMVGDRRLTTRDCMRNDWGIQCFTAFAKMGTVVYGRLSNGKWTECGRRGKLTVDLGPPLKEEVS